VTASEIRSIEPTLQGKYYGGFYTASDFTGDIHKFTNGLATACQRLGVHFRFSTDVTAIKPLSNCVRIASRAVGPARSDDKAPEMLDVFDRVVICGGVDSRHLGQQVGDRINVYPVKGYSITVHLDERVDRDAAPWTSLLDDKAKIVTSRLGPTRLRVAGTAEFNGQNRDIRATRIAPLIDWCRQHFPGMSTRQTVPWAGLRPMMPDMLPRVMRGRNPRIFYNTGHGHLGWTLSAATADAVSALVVETREAA
jgi:D-amino-acid dehydrogenase